MSYLLLGIGLLIIGIILFGIGGNIAMSAYNEATRTSENPLDYLQKIESSSYPFGLGLLSVGGVLIFAGVVSMMKNRNGGNNS